MGFELLAEAGNLAAVQNMCRGMGTFPWVPGYPPPHPATAHAAATASLFSSPALQQQLDLYYRQIAATQAAAAAQALHQQKGPSSPSNSCPTNVIPPLQLPSPANLHQHSLHYKLMPSMLPLVSSSTTPMSLSPMSKSGKGISTPTSSPVPPNQDGSSPSPPPGINSMTQSQIPQRQQHLPFPSNSNLDVSKIPNTLRPVSSIFPNSVGNICSSVITNSQNVSANGVSSLNKVKSQLSPLMSFETKCSSPKS